MLDTHARKYIDLALEKAAAMLADRGITPNQVTTAALIAGVAAGPLTAVNLPWAAAGLLWLSGLLDGLDGQLARRMGRPSPWGTFMDITFDRVVEGAVLIGLAVRTPALALPLLVLAVSFTLSLTIFLTTGALARGRPSVKSFYYQAGIMERTEGFIAFTALMLLPAYAVAIACVTAGLEAITIGQRVAEARQLLK